MLRQWAPSSSNQTQRRRGQGARRGQPQDQSRTIKFEGRCEELSGHVYNYVNLRKATDQFTKTTREVCEYIGHTYTYGEDTKIALETLSRPTLVAMPEDPADTTQPRLKRKSGKSELNSTCGKRTYLHATLSWHMHLSMDSAVTL